jgi:ankyrin repeat protein
MQPFMATTLALSNSSPNSIAIGRNNQDMVKYLLSRVAEPNANTTIGASRALEAAAYRASLPILEALLDAGAELKGRRALPTAAGEGRTDAVAFLLERGADINEIPDNDDMYENERGLGVENALCQAAWRGQTDAVELLLERGADWSVKDTKGRSAWELAEMAGHASCTQILTRYAST